MPRTSVPKLSHHRASGQAVVRLGGQDFYLGPWGTRTARREYDRVIAEWLANGRHAPAATAAKLLVAEIMAQYIDFVDGYYRRADGTPTTEPVIRRRSTCGLT